MSDEQAKSPLRSSKEPKVTHAPKSGGSNKTGLLLAGVAAVALLLGGGYYAWQNSSPSQVASNDNTSTYSSPSSFSDTAGAETAANNGAAENNSASAVTDDAQTAAESKPAAPKKARVAAAVPEETIGVSRVSATTTTQSDEVIVNSGRRPVWRYTPRAERLAEYYPAAALDRGREGEASLHCIVGEKGKLACERVSEYPAKAGFGTAALQVSRTLRHAEQRADGKNALGTPVNLRVVFRMAEGERRRG